MQISRLPIQCGVERSVSWNCQWAPLLSPCMQSTQQRERRASGNMILSHLTLPVKVIMQMNLGLVSTAADRRDRTGHPMLPWPCRSNCDLNLICLAVFVADDALAKLPPYALRLDPIVLTANGCVQLWKVSHIETTDAARWARSHQSLGS